jgi:hypothetical protein
MIESNKEIKREGIYKEYYDKFGEDPITYGLFWDNLIVFENMLKESIKKDVKYIEQIIESNIVY